MAISASSPAFKAIRQEIASTPQPRLKEALTQAIADNQLDDKDYQNLRSAWKEANPGCQ